MCGGPVFFRAGITSQMTGDGKGTGAHMGENLGIPSIDRKEQGALPPYVEALLFLVCGLIIGAGMTVFLMDNSVRDFFTHPDQLPDRMLLQMDRRLDLTPTQREAAAAVIAEHFATFDTLRQQVQPAVQATLDAMRDDVATILDPDQRVLWLENFERIREKWQPGPLVPAP